MIIDTSALLVILFAEPEMELFARAIADSPLRIISTANWLEGAIIADSRSSTVGGREFDYLIERCEIQVQPVTKMHADVARRAYLTFGKGNHPAGLNYGDCFSYALSIVEKLPLLYKGDDFRMTDVKSVF